MLDVHVKTIMATVAPGLEVSGRWLGHPFTIELISTLDKVGVLQDRQAFNWWVHFIRPRGMFGSLPTNNQAVWNSRTQNYKLFKKTKDEANKPFKEAFEEVEAGFMFFVCNQLLKAFPTVKFPDFVQGYAPRIDKDWIDGAFVQSDHDQTTVWPFFPNWALFGYKNDSPMDLCFMEKDTWRIKVVCRNDIGSLI